MRLSNGFDAISLFDQKAGDLHLYGSKESCIVTYLRMRSFPIIIERFGVDIVSFLNRYYYGEIDGAQKNGGTVIALQSGSVTTVFRNDHANLLHAFNYLADGMRSVSAAIDDIVNRSGGSIDTALFGLSVGMSIGECYVGLTGALDKKCPELIGSALCKAMELASVAAHPKPSLVFDSSVADLIPAHLPGLALANHATADATGKTVFEIGLGELADLLPNSLPGGAR